MVKIYRNFSLAQVKIISPECHFDLKHYTVQKNTNFSRIYLF